MKINSILIIGASGRTGNHIIRELHNEEILLESIKKNNDNNNNDDEEDDNDNKREQPIVSRPKVFAFCRDPSKMPTDTQRLCDGIIRGNPRSTLDLRRGLTYSRADLVVVTVGDDEHDYHHGSPRTNMVRTKSAEALVPILSNKYFQKTRVIVISCLGAGDSSINVGFGKGKMLEWNLRHVLRDHSGQEAAFMNNSRLRDRTMIVRPTTLTENEATGNIIAFREDERCPTMRIDRKDLADWLILESILGCPKKKGGTNHFGSKPITITCAKNPSTATTSS